MGPPTPPHPIEALLQEIEKALEAKLFYLALLLTLTLPDICAALEQPSGRTDNGGLYRKWYKSNIYKTIGGLTPSEAWEFRCTIVHQSRSDPAKKRAYERIIFTIPGGLGVDSMILNGALTFQIKMFCDRWLKQVRLWLETAKNDPVVQRNSVMLLQVRPAGLFPYIEGMQIIA